MVAGKFYLQLFYERFLKCLRLYMWEDDFMKRFLALFLALSLLSLTACDSAESTVETTMEQVNMLYYLDLGDNSIMAACYTQEGIQRLGQDYYVVLVDNAEFYNTAGESFTLDQLTRGCPIRITWPGMVMESYPAQLSATKIEQLSDTPDPSVPEPDAIEPLDGGTKWWEPEPVTQVPDLQLGYTFSEFSVSMRVEPQLSSWACYENTSGTAKSIRLDGQSPNAWTYDDNNTITAQISTLSLTFSPAAQSVSVTAYAYGDDSDQGTEISLDTEGNFDVLAGDYIYVVSAQWDTEDYSGSGIYGFLVAIK
jgi:hypothetical protein